MMTPSGKICMILVVVGVVGWVQGTLVNNKLQPSGIQRQEPEFSTTDNPMLLPEHIKPQVPVFIRRRSEAEPVRKAEDKTYVFRWGDIDALMLEGFIIPIVKPQGPPPEVPTLDPETLQNSPDGQGILDEAPAQDTSDVSQDVGQGKRAYQDVKIDVSGTNPVMCGNYDLRAGSGVKIETPYYPTNYIGNFKCRWTLTDVDGGGLLLDCPVFQLGQGDVLTTVITDQQGSWTKYQWKKGPTNMVLDGTSVTISFSSNKRKHAPGFSCTVTSLSTSSTTLSTTTTPTTTTKTSTATTTTPTTSTSTPTTTRPVTTTTTATTSTSTTPTTTTSSTSTTPTTTTTTTRPTTTSTTPTTTTTTRPTTTSTTTTPTTTTSTRPTTTSTSTTTPTTTTTTSSTTTTIPTTTLPPLSHPDCGIANRDTVRVVNGQSASPNEYPWQSFLEIKWSDNKNQLCGGSLITRQWILTAAHCVLRKFDNGTLWKPNVDVTLGMHTRTNPLANGGFKVTAAAVEIYPENNFSHDLALIKLPREVDYRREVRPVCLPNRYLHGRNVTGELMALIGWGKTETGQLTNELRELSRYGIEAVVCRKVFGSYITDHHFCTSGIGVKHICLGDSGGPVMTVDRGRFTLTGVVSFVATQDCTGEYPDGHTSVSHFLDWIQNMVNQTLY